MSWTIPIEKLIAEPAREQTHPQSNERCPFTVRQGGHNHVRIPSQLCWGVPQGDAHYSDTAVMTILRSPFISQWRIARRTRSGTLLSRLPRGHPSSLQGVLQGMPILGHCCHDYLAVAFHLFCGVFQGEPMSGTLLL